MFFDLRNISSVSEPLKTGAVDTRLNDKKDEDSQNNKRSENESVEETNSSALSSESNTTKESVNRFSLDSLIYFLEDFLEENMILPTAQKSDGQDDLKSGPKEKTYNVSTMAPWLRSKHINSNSISPPSFSSMDPKERRNAVPPRYAAHAYAHRALSNSADPSTQRKMKQHGAYEGQIGSFPNAHERNQGTEINDIYNLIRNLRTMKKHGSTYLDVRDNAALLEGISAAIHKNAPS